MQKQSPKKKVLLEISQNSQESNCARVSFLIKLQGLRPENTFSYRAPLVAVSADIMQQIYRENTPC